MYQEVKIDELRVRQSLNLDEKINWAIEKYLDFVETYKNVYIAFSGGKDSQVLADIIDKLYDGYFSTRFEYRTILTKIVNQKPPKVFVNSGLEYPEIISHVNKFSVIKLKPKKRWIEYLKEEGFLIGSKKVSAMLKALQNPTSRNINSRNTYLSGINTGGNKTLNFKLPQRWHKLINAPFKVSNNCCNVLQKQPLRQYERDTSRKPIIATTADESDLRTLNYLRYGCNIFGNNPMSRPLSIWTERDIWEYHDRFNLRFADIYYDRVVDGKKIEKEKRSGCLFCMVGSPQQLKVKYEKLELSHKKQFDFLINKIGIGAIFDYIGIQRKYCKKCGTKFWCIDRYNRTREFCRKKCSATYGAEQRWKTDKGLKLWE